MLTKMRNMFRTAQGRARSSTLAGPPILSGAELARSSWAKPIEAYPYVPAVYKDFFDPFLAAGRPFPYTVLTPSHERFIHRTSEKLICDLENEIYILERNGNTFETKCYPLEGISYVEFRTALLASSIKICGLTNQGVYTSSKLIFNSVTDYLFRPILNTVRRFDVNATKTSNESQPEQFDHLAKVNYKFMNYANHSLLGGEQVIQSILHFEIRERFLAFLGKAYFRTISPTHMTILTDRELIVIQEEAVRRKEDKYGGIWDYIPLSKIVSLSLGEKDDNLLVLSIQLPGNVRLELLFQVFARRELTQLIDRFRELTRNEKLEGARINRG